MNEDKGIGWKGSIAWISRMAARISGFLMMLAMFTIIIDLSGRYFFNSPLAGGVELVRTFLVVIVFFGLAQTQLNDDHIRMDLLLNYSSGKTKFALEIFGLIIALLIYAFITYTTIPVMIQSIAMGEYETGLIPFPMWPARIFMSAGLFFLVLQLASDLIHKTKFRRKTLAASEDIREEVKWTQF